MPERFTVSELRNAAACPRLCWFDARRAAAGRPATWLGREAPRNRRIPGRLFHRLLELALREAPGAADLHRAMANGAPARVLADWFYDRHGGRALSRFQGDWVRLWDGLERFFGLLARLVEAAGGAPGAALERVVLGREEPLAWTFGPPDLETEIRLEGRSDALLFDPRDKRVLLIDFKSPGAGEAPEEQLQVAAYALLLERMSGLKARPVLARFDGELDLEEVPAETAAALADSIPALLVQMKRWAGYVPGEGDPPPAAPDLCPLCPWARTCEATLGPRGGAPLPAPEEQEEIDEGVLPPPPWRGVEASEEGQQALQAAVAALAEHRLAVEPIGVDAGPTFLRLRLKPGPGVKVSAIRNRAEDLQVALGLPRPPLVSGEAGWVSLEVARKERLPVRLADILAREEAVRQSAFPLGVGADGLVHWVDLADPSTGHLLVAGGTGSGKSELLRSMLAALAAAGAPEFLRFTLIDPKLVTFTDFAGNPFLSGPVATASAEAEELLTGLVREVEERYARMSVLGVSSLEAWSRKAPCEAPPRRVVVFDEYADFMMDKEGRKRLEGHVMRLGAKARAAGIHLVIATQRPDRSVVTGPIKANLPARICFKVESRVDSQVVLDRPGGENLLGKGDLLARMAGRTFRLQAPLGGGTDKESES